MSLTNDFFTEQTVKDIAVYREKTRGNEALAEGNWWSVADFARYFGVKVSTVYYWVKMNYIPSDMVDRVIKGEGRRFGRIHLSGLLIEEMEKRQSILIEDTRKYWIKAYSNRKKGGNW
jgi:hypothetical protein